MRKIAPPAATESGIPRRARPSRRPMLAVLLGLALAPYLYESALVCAANWRAMYGRSTVVETPWLDAAGSTLGAISRDARERTRAAFRNLPWRPSLVISVGIALAVFTSLPLRKAGH